MIADTAEPFFIPGSSTGCLLIHGFTGAPTEMRPLGKYLARQGYSVLGVRLFGHGTTIADLKRARWRDWVHSVQDGWHLLNKQVEKIYLIGLSMGGVLALHQAAHLPAAGVVSMSAPYRLGPDPRLPFLPLLAPFFPYISKGDSDWHDRDADQEHFSYQKYPTRAIQELNQLIKKMRSTLPSVTHPVLLLHSQADKTVPPIHVEWIHSDLGTAPDQKKKILVENSGHVLTRDAEKDTVFQAIGDFLQHE